ncbi:hypothetical protein N7454_001515 [Penicillium verhagenii]|nr:hypothetical protein N7454_001515 [Penicillium verhagenii]
MRLLKTNQSNAGNFEIEIFTNYKTPPYAILSHTWGEDEVTLQDMEGDGVRAKSKTGFYKIKNCCALASANGLDHVWIDTCCIDKTSSAELSEAINSMYRWYKEAEVCYAYLADVPSKCRFEDSKWFTRGWTLQELIAPEDVVFLNDSWQELGSKEYFQQTLSDCTRIPIEILSGDAHFEMFSIAQRMFWASKRETTRIEDRAYSLMGLFDIYMPLIYGEREMAFVRLQEEIIKASNDHTIFAWRQDCEDHHAGLLASSPEAFAESYNIIQAAPFTATSSLGSPITINSMGIHLELRLIGIGPQGLALAILHCKDIQEENKMIAIYLKDRDLTMEQFRRVGNGQFHQVDLAKFNPLQYPVRMICVEGGRMTRRWKKTLDKHNPTFPMHIYSNNVLTQLMSFGDPTAISKAAASGDEDLVWLLLTRSDVNIEARADKLGPSPLQCAILNGKSELVKTLLRRGAKLNVEDMLFETCLSRALSDGHEALVKLFLGRGIDIEINERQSQQLLFMAAKSRNLEDTVNLVLDKGTKIDAQDFAGQTPLIIAAKNGNENIVKLL